MKRFYAKTNKTKTFVTQIAKHIRRERVLRKIIQCGRVEAANNTGKQSPPSLGGGTSDLPLEPQVQANLGQPSIPFEQLDPLPLTPPEVHHHISNTQQLYENIPRWLDLHDGDLALVVCLFLVVLPFTFTDFTLRISFRSLRTTSYHASWDTYLMATFELILMMSVTQWKFYIIGYTNI